MSTEATKPMALLFDAVRCAGCRACVKACMNKQGFEGEAKDVTELSATAYTAMVQEGETSVRKMCRHCVSPSCASVCPVGALKKDPLGPVTYEASKCIGCRYCMVACPFNVPRYEWDKAVPAVRKCDMCIDRVRDGKPTACAAACKYEATVFGTRDEMIAEAHRRVAEDPDMYYDHVYGEKEIGGTSVLFLAPRPMESLGFKESLGEQPLPSLTWRVLEKIPAIVVCGGAALMGIWWITQRRNEVAEIEARKAQARKEADHESA